MQTFVSYVAMFECSLPPFLSPRPKSEDVQTEPPPRANFSDTVNQWIIYDAYTNYEKMKELQVTKFADARRATRYPKGRT